MEENKKSKLGLGILIGVLITLVIGLSAFVVYDKVLTKDDNEQVETESNSDEEENSSNNLEYNYSEIDKLLNEELGIYINFRVITDGSNILNTSEGRLELVNSVLMKSELCNWYDDGTTQKFPYIGYHTYKEKYIELYGDANNLEQDLDNVSGPVANDCSDVSSLSGNNICWNGTWGVTPNNIKLKSEKISEVSKDSYKITGTYTNEYNNENGIFEIEYFNVSNIKYLTTLKLIKNN